MRYEVRAIDLESAKTLSNQTIYDFAPGIGLVRVEATHGGTDRRLTAYDVSNDAPAAIR
jgi:hypothetical protein